MFKIGQLEKIENEEFWVDTVNVNHYNYIDKTHESFETLEFNIKGNIE